MVIEPCAKYGMQMSKLTEVIGRHEDMTKAYKFELKVKNQDQVLAQVMPMFKFQVYTMKLTEVIFF